MAVRILVVDDSRTMRRILVQQLGQAGFPDVDEAEDGLDGLAKLEAGLYDLVLTDLNMPRLDGLGFIREVRKREDLKDLPVLLVTTRGSEDDVLAAVKEGANNYLTKPLDLAVVKRKIGEVLAASGNGRQR